MANADTHAAIRRVFRTLGVRNGTPVCISQRQTRYELAKVFVLAGFTVGVEVGVRRGKFSAYLCEQVPGLRLSCIDPWVAYGGGPRYGQARQDEIYRIAVERLAPFTATILRQPSLEAVRAFADESLDAAFIDGDHTFDAVMEDIIQWSPKVRSGGLMIVHDYYRWSGGGVVQAVDAYLSGHDIRPWYVTKEHEPTAFWVRP